MSEISKRVAEAVDYLKNIDIKALELGNHVINDWLNINVQEYITKPARECRFESHRKYVDIQMMISGVEAIETADIGKLEIAIEYNQEQDVAFWKQIPDQMKSVIADNSYVVLYPQNAHMPCIAVDKPLKVRKLVAKVLIP